MTMMFVEQPWVAEAACRGLDPSFFFPQVTDGNAASEEARSACARCTVRDECLEANLDEKNGVWGGTTPKERRAIRAERRAAALAAR